jgi:beta-lactamase class A
VLSHLPGVADMTLGDLAAITLTVSDNTAANLLIERVGIDRVDQRLDEWGCPRTRLRRALFDLAAQARGLENVMTAGETASLLRRVIVGARNGDPALRRLLRLLEWNTDQSRLGRYLPLQVSLAHKDGWLYDPVPVDNDAGIVRARATGATNARGSDAELDSLLAVPAAVVVGFTEGVDARVARPSLGMLGLAAAEVAGVDLGTLPSEVVGSA